MRGLDLIGATGIMLTPVEPSRTRLLTIFAIAVVGATGGAYLWKAHRVWGGVLGWMAGSVIGQIAVKGA